jgi:hypothetical protein
MSQPIQLCPHTEQQSLKAACDCGRGVTACIECFAAGKVLACGQCEIAEATSRVEGSIVIARKAAELLTGSENPLDGLKGALQDIEIKVRFIQNYFNSLQQEDREGEEWKDGPQGDED